jgi:predicted nucleotide-binding protein (sugar kinase/HSP70/actin superfamily)
MINLLNKIINKFNKPVLSSINKSEYEKQIERAYRAGYNYHQNMIKKDPELLNWVLKDNYLE